MESTRKLAAIMFTDIQGYTALMQTDETKAMEMRNRHREVFQRLHKKHNGTILQYYGDGTLSVFDSAIDAAQCGVDMQKELQEEPKVPLRIGIHTGDILYSDTEAIGDGVNVASRVESVAVPGSVMISGKVYDYIKNQKGIPVQPMGSFNFKNVEKPLEVYALGLEGLVVPKPESLSGKFVRHTHKPANSFLHQYKYPLFALAFCLVALAAWGIYAITNSSGGTSNISSVLVKDENGNVIEKKVVSASLQKKIHSVNFKSELKEEDEDNQWLGVAIPFALETDWDQDPYMLNIYDERDQTDKPLNGHLEDAEKRRLDYLLQGTYARTEDGFRFQPELISVQTGQQERSWSFEGPDLLQLIDKASLQIKKDLGVPESHLGEIKDLPLDQQLTEFPDAYKKFIQGIGHMSGNIGKGMQLIEDAIADDETFAYANLTLAIIHHQLSFSRDVAEKSIAKAMQHRKRLSETNETMVRMLNFRIAGEPEKAVQLAQMMADLRPTQADLQLSLTEEYRLLGLWDKALESIRKYQIARDDPDAAIEGELNLLFIMDKIKEGKKRGESFMKRNPENVNASLQLGKIYLREGSYDKAKSLFEKASLLDPENKSWDNFLGHIAFMQDSAEFLTEETFKNFEGSYEVEYRKLPLLVTADYPFLLLKIENQSNLIFFPSNTTDFFSEREILRVKFDKDLESEATQMYLSERNSPFMACFKEDETIKKAHALLEEKKYEEALPLFQSSAKKFPDHYYLNNYVRHIEFMQKNADSWTEKVRNEFTGSYKAKKKPIIGTMTQKDGDLYLHQVNFPGTIKPAVILPMSETEFLVPNSLASTLSFTRKGKRVVDLSLFLKERKMGTLIKE